MAQIERIVVPRGEMFGGSGVATLTTYRKTQSTTESFESDRPLDLNNLPFDIAEEAMKECAALAKRERKY
jgi:hypothetical protein